MTKLYMFYLGGNAGRSNIEVHDIQFAVCDDYREAIPALKAAWFGDADKIHIDGWQVVEWVDGYDVDVSDHAEPKGSSENVPHLYFVNVGGYRAGQLAEAHAFGLFAAATPAEAVGLFLSKDFHAVILPEPMASAAMLRGKMTDVTTVRGFDIVKAWAQAFDTKPLIPMAGIIADEAYFHAHKAQFDTFHQDLKNALAWINGHRAEAAKIGKNYLPAPEPALVSGIDGARLTVTKPSEIKTEILHFYEILMQFNPKLLGGKMPDSGFFLA